MQQIPNWIVLYIGRISLENEMLRKEIEQLNNPKEESDKK